MAKEKKRETYSVEGAVSFKPKDGIAEMIMVTAFIGDDAEPKSRKIKGNKKGKKKEQDYVQTYTYLENAGKRLNGVFGFDDEDFQFNESKSIPATIFVNAPSPERAEQLCETVYRKGNLVTMWANVSFGENENTGEPTITLNVLGEHVAYWSKDEDDEEEEETTSRKRKRKSKSDEDDDEEETTSRKRKRKSKSADEDDDEDDEEEEKTSRKSRKSKKSKADDDDEDDDEDEEEEKKSSRKSRKSKKSKVDDDDEDDDEDEEEEKKSSRKSRKSKKSKAADDDEDDDDLPF